MPDWNPTSDWILWVLAIPVLFIRWSFRMIRRWKFLRMSYEIKLVCRNCHSTISLVGIWRCGCGYTYRGHVLRICPVCDGWPRMVRCYECGVTEKLPEP